jgi:N-acetylglucosaminyl-diphospho-decaprenol L-rhamnosyltransferase
MENKIHYKFVISIVSHNQIELVNQLISDLNSIDKKDVGILLRKNIPENGSAMKCKFPLFEFDNLNVHGFGANHNKNFEIIECEYFVVVNPDIRIHDKALLNKFEELLMENPQCIIVPRVYDSKNQLEDSVREFPSPIRIIKKLLLGKKGTIPIDENKPIQSVDWAGGMFQVYPREVFKKLMGFDERYFMYYEDVDICLRAKKLNFKILVANELSIVHDAQRESHRNLSLRLIHIKSLFRFLKQYICLTK